MIALLLALGLFAAPGLARAQAGGATWVSLDGQPAGTPARVVLDLDHSSPDETWLDVYISGMWSTTRVGGDGRIYQDVRIPGLPTTVAPGFPRLPVVRAELGMTRGAASASLIAAIPIDVRTFPGYQVWPSPIPALVHDGTPEQFVRDSAAYASATDLPAGDGYAGATRAVLGGLPASLATANPVHWNPATGVLTVAVRARYGFAHGGMPTPPMGLTREHADLASQGLFNWGSIASNVVVDYLHFSGCFLFVCPSAWVPKLQKLVSEKKTRGFSVSVVNVPLSGETCSALRQSIQTWYAGTSLNADHYCILVGDTNSAALCRTFDQVTDKRLSSVDNDFEPEIHLGRIFVSNETQLDVQVQKILDYEIGPQQNNDNNVLLVAHRQQDQTFDFAAEQETVRTRTYAQVTPGFIPRYGGGGAGNADVTSDINGGVGVAAYYGHGEPNRWDRWTQTNASYTNLDAAGLANGPRTPVLWSIACSTGDLRDPSCLAVAFMRNAGGGAVASYGAVDPIYGYTAQVLNETLFQAVYGQGITRHGPAIALAEHATYMADSLFGFDTEIKFVLYGDPEMEIKRRNPGGVNLPLDVVAPPWLLAPCPGVTCCPGCAPPTVDIQVKESSGAPRAGVKVGVWKPTAAGSDELLDNRYTDAEGWVHIPAPMITAGTLYYGWDDGDARAGMDSIEVRSPADVDGVPSASLVLSAAPSVTSGATRIRFGRPLERPGRIAIYSVDGRRVRAMSVPGGAREVPWDGLDAHGRRVASGAYLLRLDTGDARAFARVAVVR